MLAYIRDNHHIYLEQITPDCDETLAKHFSVVDPRHFYIDTDGEWDGVYRKYNAKLQRLALPFLEELKICCEKHHIPLEVVDERMAPNYPAPQKDQITKDFIEGMTLENYQVEALQASCDNEIGIIDAPTGSGKTLLICGQVKLFRCPTVIITEQIIVLDQIIRQLKLRGVVHKDDIGQFCYGFLPNNNLVIVGSIQSVSLPKEPKKEDIKIGKAKASKMLFDIVETQDQKIFDIFPKHIADKLLITENWVDQIDDYIEYFTTYYREQEWNRRLKWYSTRIKKARLIQKLISKCDMLICDECVAEDTLISTNRGLMPAKTLYEIVVRGDNVSAVVGNRSYPITSCAEKYSDSLKITTGNNRTLICSKEHKIATLVEGRRVDKYAKDLLVDDVLLCSAPIISTNRESDDFKRWYHLGLFIGDGHFLSDKQIRYGVRKDRQDWIKMTKEMALLWDGLATCRSNIRDDLVICLNSEKFIDWISELGFKKGRKMGNIKLGITIPNHNCAAGLLSGLFDSEGTAYQHYCKFGCTDYEVVRQSQIFLSYLGISSYVTTENKRKSPKHANTWRVKIHGEDYVKFCELAGFRFERKLARSQSQRVKLSGNRHIYASMFLRKWLSSGLSQDRLLKILGLNGYFPTGMVSLDTLMRWRHDINELATMDITTYSQAREFFGISDTKVAKHIGCGVMTAWGKRVNKKDDGQWLAFVDHLKKELLGYVAEIDELTGFTTELVKKVELDAYRRLLDFSVDGAQSFDANGVIVHNCDLCTSKQYAYLLRYIFKGRRRYGHSGTPWDTKKPVQNLILKENLGSVIYKTSRAEVQATGRIIPVRCCFIGVGMEGDRQDSRTYDIAMKEDIVDNEKLQNMTAKLARSLMEKGERVLILIDTSPIEPLGVKLESLIPNSQFLFGETPRKKRNEAILKFESGELKCLIGSKILRRGFDILSGTENLIIIGGGKMRSDFTQVIGRAVRINERGFARVYAFFHLSNRYLYSHSREQLKAAIDTGYPVKVIIGDKQIDGISFVKKRFRI